MSTTSTTRALTGDFWLIDNSTGEQIGASAFEEEVAAEDAAALIWIHRALGWESMSAETPAGVVAEHLGSLVDCASTERDATAQSDCIVEDDDGASVRFRLAGRWFVATVREL